MTIDLMFGKRRTSLFSGLWAKQLLRIEQLFRQQGKEIAETFWFRRIR